MTRTLLDVLNPSDRVLKRAQYEAFSFSLLGGDLLVRNESHLHPEDHEYRVIIGDGVPTECSCPADAIYDSPCKHRTAVAIRPQILAVAAQMQFIEDRFVTSSGDRLPESSNNSDL